MASLEARYYGTPKETCPRNISWPAALHISSCTRLLLTNPFARPTRAHDLLTRAHELARHEIILRACPFRGSVRYRTVHLSRDHSKRAIRGGPRSSAERLSTREPAAGGCRCQAGSTPLTHVPSLFRSLLSSRAPPLQQLNRSHS